MAENRAKPTGMKKLFFKAPSYLFKWHLGFVFGERFLMIEHRGRTSGKPYSTVLEVAGRTEAGEFVSTSGYGPKADWYRNLQANGVDAVWLGSKRHEASARFMDADESAGVFATYEADNPKIAARLMEEMNVSYDGTDDGRIEMMRSIPMVAFKLSAAG